MEKDIMNNNRRDALKKISLLFGYTFSSITTTAFISGCSVDNIIDWVPKSLNADMLNILEAATERILPKTDTPGANDALVHRYIDEVITIFYSDQKRINFINQLEIFNKLSREKYKKIFIELSPELMDDILNIMAKEWKATSKDDHIFKQLRDLTVTGFATSEIGAKEFFIYDPIPGPYIGCIPYEDVKGTYALP